MISAVTYIQYLSSDQALLITENTLLSGADFPGKEKTIWITSTRFGWWIFCSLKHLNIMTHFSSQLIIYVFQLLAYWIMNLPTQHMSWNNWSLNNIGDCPVLIFSGSLVFSTPGYRASFWFIQLKDLASRKLHPTFQCNLHMLHKKQQLLL